MKPPGGMATAALGWRVLAWLRPHGWRVVGGLGLAVLASLAGIGLLALAGWFLAAMALAGAGGQRIDYFTPAACIRALALTRIGSRYSERLLNHDITLRSLQALRGWLFDKLWRQSPVQTAWLGRDELFSRLRAEVDRLEQVYLAVCLPACAGVLSLLGALLLEAYYLWSLALTSLLLALLAGWGLAYGSLRRGRVAAQQVAVHEARLRRLLGEAVRGARELAFYGRLAALRQQVSATDQALLAARQQLEQVQSLSIAAWPLVMAMATLLTVGLAGHAAVLGKLAPAQVAMLGLLQLAAFEALAPAMEAVGPLVASLAAAERVFALAEVPPRPEDPLLPVALPESVPVAFAYESVSMRYATAGHWVCQNLTLALPPGLRVAVYGPSGAGKSSLLALMLRFIDPDRGEVRLADRRLSDYAQATVREQVALADQQAHIFNASLRDNLWVARPQATSAELERVLEIAQLSAWVARLPEGLETWLGEGGARVSGGEARRIAIARALLAERPLLALDEPIEGLDADTARNLLAALAESLKERSVLLISHGRQGLTGWMDAQFELVDGRLYRREILAMHPTPEVTGMGE